MILDLRTHHLDSAKYVTKTDFSEVANYLKWRKYTTNFRNPFIDAILKLKRLFKNPAQEIRLQVGGLDFLCVACPPTKKGNCNLSNPKPNALPAFTPGNSIGACKDLLAIKKYDLIAGEVYTVRELRQTAGF